MYKCYMIDNIIDITQVKRNTYAHSILLKIPGITAWYRHKSFIFSAFEKGLRKEHFDPVHI